MKTKTSQHANVYKSETETPKIQITANKNNGNIPLAFELSLKL